MSEEPTFLRTADKGTFEIYNGRWGSYLRPCFDPEYNATIKDEHLSHFEVREDIDKIPAELWTRWVKLCFHFVNKGINELEVSVRFLQNIEDPTKYMAIVPRQSVTTVTVDAAKLSDSIDLTTGEKVTSYPPAGWDIVGSSHSHHTMGTTFSPRDDSFELGDPGFHIIVGSVSLAKNNYQINASIVGNGRRFHIPYDKLLDATPISGVDFHPDVLDYIDCTPSKITVYSGNFSNWKSKQSKSTNSVHSPWNSGYDVDSEWARWVSGEIDQIPDGEWYGNNPLNDPFFVSDNGFVGRPAECLQIGYDIDYIEKHIHDVIKDHRNDTDALEELQQSLSSILIDLQMEISS
jgi:hypothetical protein